MNSVLNCQESLRWQSWRRPLQVFGVDVTDLMSSKKLNIGDKTRWKWHYRLKQISAVFKFVILKCIWAPNTTTATQQRRGLQREKSLLRSMLSHCNMIRTYGNKIQCMALAGCPIADNKAQPLPATSVSENTSHTHMILAGLSLRASIETNATLA